MQSSESRAGIEGDDEHNKSWNEERDGRRWGIVVFPEVHGNQLEWGLFKGWYKQDLEARAHCVGEVAPMPEELLEHTRGAGCNPSEERWSHLSFPGGIEYVRSIEDVVREVYWHTLVLSEDRIPGEYELFRSLMAEWVWRMLRQGRDPATAMAHLLEKAVQEVEGWNS